MTGPVKSGRVALVAAGAQADALRDAFRLPLLASWDAFAADGCEHAHFLVQMDACDVLVVDHSALGGVYADCLGWLTSRPEVPVLFLSEDAPELILHALANGARQWLPRSLALGHPATLDAALRHAVLGRASAPRAADSLHDSRAQVTRLVNLLWDATPTEGRPRWFSQRYMLERLYEEVCRSQRHGGPLALVLGEAWPESNRSAAEASARWVAERIQESKRRCDVAGQYGPDGFMVLLPQTPPEGAAHYCRRLRGLLEETVPVPPAPARLRCCFGVAGCAAAAASSKSLLRQAEEQLDEARATRLAGR